MKHKIFSHTSLLIILSVILTFLAAGTVMYNRYDIYMKQGVRDEAAYIKTGLEEDGDVFLSDRVGAVSYTHLKIQSSVCCFQTERICCRCIMQSMKLLTVSYTHLDVYKRQVRGYQ